MLTTSELIYLSLVAGTYILLLFYCIRYVLRYKHVTDSNKLCTSVVIACIFVVLLTTLILPADIFLASFVKFPDGSPKNWATNETLTKIDNVVFGSYYALYATIIFMIVIVIPLTHFLNDSLVNTTRANRIRHALRNTFWFALAATVLIGIGAFVPTKQTISDNVPNNSITISFNQIQDAINMIMTFITFFGLINVVFYTASGIMSWPISFILGNARLSSRTGEISERELDLRLRISSLQEKSRVTQLSSHETDALNRAIDELRILEREESALNNYSDSWTYKLRKLIRPIQITFGVFVCLLSILIVANLSIVNVDRFMHGLGPKKGYILYEAVFLNPLEYIFINVHNLILLGPIPLLMINCLLVAATISGMRNLGLWFLVARIHKIRVGKTQPQAMLFFCTSLMLAVVAFNVLFYSLTPNYVTFGNQDHHLCQSNTTMINSINSIRSNQTSEKCIRTRTSILLMGMMSQVWVFGAIFFWMTWVFVAVSTISLIAYLIRGRREASHGLIDNPDDFED